jgi:hypothetical protein
MEIGHEANVFLERGRMWGFGQTQALIDRLLTAKARCPRAVLGVNGENQELPEYGSESRQSG